MDAFSDYPTRPRSRRGRFVGLLGWGLSLALLALAGLVLRDRMDAVGRAGGLPGPLAVATAVVVYLVANAVLAEAWRRVVGLVGTDLHRRDAAWVWAASQLGRYAVGPAQVAGRAVLARRYGLSMTAGAVTALAELAWLISLTAVLAVATVPFWLPGAGDLTWLAAVAVVPAANQVRSPAPGSQKGTVATAKTAVRLISQASSARAVTAPAVRLRPVSYTHL